ncbi:E3 UFM1-protein ligase 1 homolog [Striga asiatica]|uniref:E3 UFM1-protein ligase 1 homolog n=1 Tax=Striga asiatica TaxID=4170 RepID=A0A5A7P130_STRAF|nr:E3 UFM1-protein ligase 1 homolog [Striga asiatica]
MAEEMRPLFDASAYVLFEAIGDSEAEDFNGVGSVAAAEDDAQSCSGGSASGGARGEVAGADGGGVDPRPADVCDRVREEEEEGSDLEDGVVDQRRGGGTASPAAEGVKMMMGEREGDRLFWEACLASRD